MALTVTQRIEEGFGILQLAGPLTLGPSLNQLRESGASAVGEREAERFDSGSNGSDERRQRGLG